MDAMNLSNPEPESGTPAPSSSKLGIFGIAVSLLGFVIFCLPIAAAFFMGASGNVPPADSRLMMGMGFMANCGGGIGVIGGVLGIVGLVRNENKTYGIIAIVLSVLLLCSCAALSLFGMVGTL